LSAPAQLRGRGVRRVVALLFVLAPLAAQAYGPVGHLIAGRAAEPMLCQRAAGEIARLTGGEDLGEIGLWADRIRSDEAYADSAPWHYMNIADGEPLAAYEHPPEGDVLFAIERFSARLGDGRLGDAERAEALRFLVHFVVDLHQPLHVGLAEDRGGNTIELRFRGEPTNLHRFWDTDAIAWADLSLDAYVAALSTAARPAPSPELDPLVWAGESLELRARVYDFGPERREPPRAYLDFAAETTRERLRLASLRLAATLNAILC